MTGSAVTGNVHQLGQGKHTGGPVGLVLSGGGVRGAYELGVLSVLAPELQRRGESPRIIVGTSVGALNAAFLAARADRGLVSAVEAGCQLWREIAYADVLGPLLSARDIGLGLRFGLEFLGLGVPGARSLLDNAPFEDTIDARVSFSKLAANVRSGVIDAVGVAATSHDTGRSVVFYDSPSHPPRDDKRAIDYAGAPLGADHVRASASIQALFPAVQIKEPAAMDGWYGDGGTSLNTPLKPALAFGAERLIVIGLNSTAGSPRSASRRRPDAFDGAAQAVQALFADQLSGDVATLATVNQMVAGRPSGAEADAPADPHRLVPYIFVAPRQRFVIGRLARDVYRQLYGGLRGLRRGRDLALLGRLLDAGRNPRRGELFSYVFFAAEFAQALIDQGRRDAEWWLEQEHDDGPWRVGDPPGAGSDRREPGAGVAVDRT